MADTPYLHTDYPKVIYKADKDGNVSTQTVHSPQEFKKAGEGWAESPDEARKLALEPPKKKEPPPAPPGT